LNEKRASRETGRETLGWRIGGADGGGVEVSGEIARDAADAALKDMKTCDFSPTSAGTVKMIS
jgi:hypothetical protein